MSRCAECQFDWEAGAEKVIQVISRFGTAYRDRLESTSVDRVFATLAAGTGTGPAA